MALNKSVSTGFGNAAEYWKIANVTEDYVGQTLTLVLSGYIDAAARQANAQPIARRDYRFMPAVDGENIPELVYEAEDDRAALYTKLKALPEWAGAVDA